MPYIFCDANVACNGLNYCTTYSSVFVIKLEIKYAEKSNKRVKLVYQ